MLWLAFAVALLLALASIAALQLRYRAYRRRLSFDPRQNCVLGMAGLGMETIPIRCVEDGFIFPELANGGTSGLLEVEVQASITGKLYDPAVEITARNFHDVQYLERDVHGVRFLNVSRLLASKILAGDRVRLSGHRLTWRARGARLHLCREQLSKNERVLVVAPHPDDAEIAAFGLYADTRATVVTVTAGDASDRYQNSTQSWISLPRGEVAQMRVWDSLTIPQFGGVPPERAINLCFPDDRLQEMYRHPDRDFRGEGENALDFPALRRMNRSSLIQGESACTWKSLVRDLASIIMDTTPTIVVAPHPILDPHPDHLFATVALGEALQFAGSTTGRMFLSTVHNCRSELWPFGPAGSGVAMLPILAEDGVCASGFYAHALSAERQRQKFVALEAMHDVRDLQWPVGSPHQQAGSRIVAELRALAHGMGRVPTSYLRRAVRPDELFFLMSIEDSIAFARRATDVRQR
jgi:LmbE family N-acetylglucosaminyl deacetylase